MSILEEVRDALARIERKLDPALGQPELTPFERQQAEIDGARIRVRNWAQAVSREDLEESIRTTYRNNGEALKAALDEISKLPPPEPVAVTSTSAPTSDSRSSWSVADWRQALRESRKESPASD